MSGNVTNLPWEEASPDLSCQEAATLLGVPAAALESWAERLAFPQNVGGGATARFRRSEIQALHDALVSAHSVEGAVRTARDRIQP